MKANKLYRWVVSLLSLFPMLFIGARSLYVSLNKNAYQSYSERADSTIVNISSNTQLEEGRIYTITYVSGLQEGTQYQVKDNVTNLKDLYFSQESFTTVTKFTLLVSAGRTRLQVFDENNNNYSVFNWESISNTFMFMSNGIIIAI